MPFTKQIDADIPVLWFNKNGSGPDEMALQVIDFPPDRDGKIPARLGLRVQAGDLVIVGAPLIAGGFFMAREQAEALHGAIGKWLDANPQSKSPPTSAAPISSSSSCDTAST